jgi:hypothetical protein
MNKNRVECDNCKYFIDPILFEPDNLFSKVKVKAKCKKGKRVMFRKPQGIMDYDYGYIRYCELFRK